MLHNQPNIRLGMRFSKHLVSIRIKETITIPPSISILEEVLIHLIIKFTNIGHAQNFVDAEHNLMMKLYLSFSDILSFLEPDLLVVLWSEMSSKNLNRLFNIVIYLVPWSNDRDHPGSQKI